MHTTAPFLLLSLAAGAFAAPAAFKRQTAGDQAACQALFELCYSDWKADYFDQGALGHRIFNEYSCLAVASCYTSNTANADLITDVIAHDGQTTTLTPAQTDKLSVKLLSILSRDSQVITAQNWLDNFYAQLDRTGGPYPSSGGMVIQFYNRIASWTGICNGQGIPLSNFQDYWWYSSGNPNNGCPGLATATVPFKPTFSGTATTTLPLNTATVQPSTENGSCGAMYSQCSVYAGNPTNVFRTGVCALAALCARINSDALILALRKGNYLVGENYSVTLSAIQPRLAYSAFTELSGGGGDISQQQFIDAYYSHLSTQIQGDGAPPGAESPVKSTKTGPYPTDPSYVIDIYKRVQAWTGYCGKNVPYNNFADYLNYAATVAGSAKSC